MPVRNGSPWPICFPCAFKNVIWTTTKGKRVIDLTIPSLLLLCNSFTSQQFHDLLVCGRDGVRWKCTTFFSNLPAGSKSLSEEEGEQLSECDFQVQCKDTQLSIHCVTNHCLSHRASDWNLLVHLHFVAIPRGSWYTGISTAPEAELLCGSCVLHAGLNPTELFYFLGLLLQALNFAGKAPSLLHIFTLPVAVTFINCAPPQARCPGSFPSWTSRRWTSKCGSWQRRFLPKSCERRTAKMRCHSSPCPRIAPLGRRRPRRGSCRRSWQNSSLWKQLKGLFWSCFLRGK